MRDEKDGKGFLLIERFSGLQHDKAPHLLEDGAFNDCRNIRTRDGSLSKRKGAGFVRHLESEFMALVTPVLLAPVLFPHGDYGVSVSSPTPLVRAGTTPADIAPVLTFPDPDEPWDAYDESLMVVDISLPKSIVVGNSFTITATAYSISDKTRVAYDLDSGTGLVLNAYLYTPGGAAAPAATLTGVDITSGWSNGAWSSSAVLSNAQGHTRLLCWVDASAVAGAPAGVCDRATINAYS